MQDGADKFAELDDGRVRVKEKYTNIDQIPALPALPAL